MFIYVYMYIYIRDVRGCALMMFACHAYLIYTYIWYKHICTYTYVYTYIHESVT